MRLAASGLARSWLATVCLCCLSAVACAGSGRKPLVLSGAPLSVTDIIEVARQGRPVEISSQARARVATTFEVVLAAARAQVPVYGLTTGVGWNKDKSALQTA